jgi:hypothetical protein
MRVILLAFQAFLMGGIENPISAVLRSGRDHICPGQDIEVLFVKMHVFVLLLFASLPDCSQNQTAVSDTLRLLSDF